MQSGLAGRSTSTLGNTIAQRQQTPRCNALRTFVQTMQIRGAHIRAGNLRKFFRVHLPCQSARQT